MDLGVSAEPKNKSFKYEYRQKGCMKTHALLIILVIVLVSGCGETQTVGEVVKEPSEETAEEIETVEEPEETQEEIVVEEPEEQEVVEEVEEPEEEPQNIVIIEIKNLQFLPSEITIPVGTTVVWQHHDRWIDNMKHKITVYFTKPPGVSPILYYGDSYNYTFTEPKKHRYIDPIYAESMAGTITVTE